MEDNNLLKPTDYNDSSNLMSFDSPIHKPTFLIPDRIESIKNSPLLTVKTEILSNISPDPDNATTPLAASTPFTKNHAPKFVYPSPMVANTLREEVSDPFDFIEQRINQLANDPFEMVAEEASKILPPPPPTITSENVNSFDKTDSLNKGFFEKSNDNKSSSGSGSDKTKENAEVQRSPKTTMETEADADDEDINQVVPPWEDGGLESDSEDDEDLHDVIRRASLDLMSSFTSSPAELLDQENIHGLRLARPLLPRQILDESDPLDLEVPPMCLDTTVMSSPINDRLASEKVDSASTIIVEEVFSQLELQVEKLPLPPRVTKPLSVITNSPAIINPPAKVDNVSKSKLPSRLASRLMQPKVFKKPNA